MKTAFTYIAIVLILPGMISCTSTRWTVKDTDAIDYNDYEIIRSTEFLKEAGTVTPDDPVLKLQLLSYATYEYAEKVLVQRTIQEYRPRPGFVALGLIGAALSVYAANTGAIAGDGHSAKRITLNAAGGLLALSGFLNMKPVGEPRKTGEERFLRRTGTSLQTDTLRVTDVTEDQRAAVFIRYDGEVIREEQNHPLSSGLLEINLGSALNALNIQGTNIDSVFVSVQFQDSTYTYTYPLTSILHPFARITAPVTELRNTPVESSNSILADLAEGSQLQITDSDDPKWYRVLYGISENYILKSDAELIWRSSEFARDNQAVAIPRIPFGNIDVETNIPVLRAENDDAVSLIITNENYQEAYAPRTYVHRDGRLIHTYFEHALGVPADHIFEIQDLKDVYQLSEPLSRIDSMATDSTELFVYMSGYGSIDVKDGELYLAYVPAGSGDTPAGDNLIDLSSFFRRIASIQSEKTIVIADIDFSHQPSDRALPDRAIARKEPLRQLSEIITNNSSRSAVLFSSEFDQHSEVYLSNSGEDKKHRIFSYFLAKALQERRTSLAEIYQYLERNVSYHARRLHDHPQDPRLFGNVLLDLASD